MEQQDRAPLFRYHSLQTICLATYRSLLLKPSQTRINIEKEDFPKILFFTITNINLDPKNIVKHYSSPITQSLITLSVQIQSSKHTHINFHIFIYYLIKHLHSTNPHFTKQSINNIKNNIIPSQTTFQNI